MADELSPLFPELPEDLSDRDAVSDEDLENLVKEHEANAALIEAEDEGFLKGASAEEVLEALEVGASQMEAIRTEQIARQEAQKQYEEKKAEQLARLKAPEAEKVEEEEAEEEPEAEEKEEVLEVVAEAEPEPEPEVEEDEPEVVEEEKVLVTASVSEPPKEKPKPAKTSTRILRRPPAPSAERQVQNEGGAMLVAAAGLQEARAGQPFDRMSLAKAMGKEADRYGAAREGTMQKVLMARANFPFPEERILGPDLDKNTHKIQAVIPEPTGWGALKGQALTASGGLCAPLTPLYDMPNFASTDEPVWDALPKFQAERGGVNVPAATIIGDITSAISNISEANDALGGTFATKSCQDLTCPAYTEVAVQILAHCREYGNLNARAWPEKIAHENDLTMAALARTSEGFMLDRIKALSVNVTNGAETLGALIYLVEAIVRAKFGIQGRLRMSPAARFRALLPFWLPDLLLLDNVQAIDGNRFNSRESLVAYLRAAGIDPVFYLDSPSTGTTQLPDASQAAAAIDSLPDNVQWALYPEGAFIGVDMGVLELGIVRDSTLNSTNDFQIFGERFRNVARLAPEQAAYWVTSDLCASGQFPPAGTARTCD